MRCQVPPEQPEPHVPLGTSINRVGLILIIPEIKVQGSVCLPGVHATGTGCVSVSPATQCPHHVPAWAFLVRSVGWLLTLLSEAAARAAAGKAEQAAGSQLGAGFLSPALWEE